MEKLLENVMVRHALTVVITSGIMTILISTGAVKCEDRDEIKQIVESVLSAGIAKAPDAP